MPGVGAYDPVRGPVNKGAPVTVPPPVPTTGNPYDASGYTPAAPSYGAAGSPVPYDPTSNSGITAAAQLGTSYYPGGLGAMQAASASSSSGTRNMRPEERQRMMGNIPGHQAGGGINLETMQPWIDSAMDQYSRVLDPQQEAERRRVEAQLAAQGLTAGTAAYDNAYANMTRGQNDARQAAMANALQAGSGLQNQIAGQYLTREGYLTDLEKARMSANAQTSSAGISAASRNYATDANRDISMARLLQDDRQFGASLLQDDRQFGANLGQRQYEYDGDLDFRYAGLNENARVADMGNALGWGQLDSQNMLGLGDQSLRSRQLDISQFGAEQDAYNNWMQNINYGLAQAPNYGFQGVGGTANSAIGAGQAMGEGIRGDQGLWGQALGSGISWYRNRGGG